MGRGGSTQAGPLGKGQRLPKDCAGHSVGQITPDPCQTRALRSDSPEQGDCETPGETRLVHRQNTCGLGMTGDQRKKQERETALQQHQGIHCQGLCTDLGDLISFSRVQAFSSLSPFSLLHTSLLACRCVWICSPLSTVKRSLYSALLPQEKVKSPGWKGVQKPPLVPSHVSPANSTGGKKSRFQLPTARGKLSD